MSTATIPVVMNGNLPTFDRREHWRLFLKHLGYLRVWSVCRWARLEYDMAISRILGGGALLIVGMAWPRPLNALRRRVLSGTYCSSRDGWKRCAHHAGHDGKHWFHDFKGTGWGGW